MNITGPNKQDSKEINLDRNDMSIQFTEEDMRDDDHNLPVFNATGQLLIVQPPLQLADQSFFANGKHEASP